MFKKTSFILYIFCSIFFILPNIARSYEINSDCMKVFTSSFIQPDTPISKILALDIPTTAYDLHVQHVFESLNKIVRFVEDNPDLTQFDRDELRVMFNLLVRTLFLPVGSDLTEYMSSPTDSSTRDDWKLFGSNSNNMFDTTLPSMSGTSLQSFQDDLDALDGIIKRSVNSYYSIYKYLSAVSQRLPTVDFNYRKNLRPKDILSFTSDPDTHLQKYGNYYAAIGDAPFVKDGPMLFNHPHLRWTIYILHKVRFLSQVTKDHIISRWDNSTVLQKALPRLTRVSLMNYNVEFFIYIHFYSNIFNTIFSNIASRWDISTGMILEQLLRYPILVDELSQAYEHLYPFVLSKSYQSNDSLKSLGPNLGFIIELTTNIPRFINSLRIEPDLASLRSINIVQNDLVGLHHLISNVDISKYLIDQYNMPPTLNKKVVDLIITLHYWIEANMTARSHLPPFGKFAFDYDYLHNQLSSLSNLDKAYVIWFIAYKAKVSMKHIIITNDGFLNWISDITTKQ